MTQQTGHAAPSANTEALMDSVDRQLLDIIQTGFPLTPRPYADLGQMLGIGEEEALALIVNGFCKEVLQKLPMEFAVEAQKLLAISLEHSVG